MAGGRPYGSPRFRSPLFITLLSLLSIAIIFFIFTPFSPPKFNTNQTLNPNVDYSFLSSLHKFISEKPNQFHDDSVDAIEAGNVKKLDDSIWRRETEKLYRDSFYPAFSSPLRVYVYEMPQKFTYDLLKLFWSTYKETVNLTSNGSPVHRLIEQHSIDYWLWADLIAPESQRLLKNVVRVRHQEDADLFYIPFFTTISFFLLEKQQCKSLYRV